MATILTVFIAIIAILLMIIVLAQNPKGGGLSSAFGNAQAANQIIGAANSTDILEKITWGLAASMLLLCLGMTAFFQGAETERGTNIEVPTVNTAPVAPTPGTEGGATLNLPATGDGENQK